MLLSLLLLGGSSAFAQRSWTPDEYYGIPKTDKVNVFYDEFDDNRNRWDINTRYLEERIQEGEYYCASLTSYTYVKHRPIAMNQSGNYEVEIRIRFVKGDDRSVTGLTFGRDIRGNEFGFFITLPILATDSKFLNTQVVPWTSSRGNILEHAIASMLTIP